MSSVYQYNISKLNKVSREVLDNKHNSDYNNGHNLFRLQVTQPQTNQRLPGPTQYVMPPVYNNHSEAYYLYLIGVAGIILNCVVIMAIILRKPLRKMTSGFLVHACFLDIMKCAFCIPIATHLLSQQKPPDCDFLGAMFVVIVTASVFNMVAMVCTEAYTFGEANIGGNSKGTLICVVFGIVLVYIGSIILHLGPTLIGGHFDFQPEIGSCSFVYGEHKGYVANIMWVTITSIAMLAFFHFLRKLNKEIQLNKPNRVSFLVRTSITVLDNTTRSACELRKIIKEASHRARMFVVNMVVFIIFWYPLFLLVICDMKFSVSPRVYQACSFIAWTHAAIQPLIYICFDRNLNILSKYFYCARVPYDIDTIAQLMLNRHRNPDQQEQRYSGDPADMSFSSPSTTIHGATTESVIDIIREHQQMCLVQNSCNQSSDHRVFQLNIQPSEAPPNFSELQRQQSTGSYDDQPQNNTMNTMNISAIDNNNDNLRRSNQLYAQDEVDYSNYDDGQC